MKKPSPWIVVLFVGGILTGCEGCSKSNDSQPATPATASLPGEGETTHQALSVEDVKVGTGAEALEGKKVFVLYKGSLPDGTVFDSRQVKTEPFDFVLGSGLMIAGWDQGIKGMREGGVRKLVIPPHLAYGSRGFAPTIPPDATLHFEIELLKVE